MYLARTGFGEEEVQLTVLVIAQVIPGLSTECQVQMAVRPSFRVKFCAEEWSCAQQEEDDDEEDVDETHEGEWGIDAETTDNESCAEEWGCVDNEKEEEKVEAGSDPNCSGEWGCFDDDVEYIETEVDTPEPEVEDEETEFVTKSLVGYVPEARMLNNTNTTMPADEHQDFVDDLMETLMSSTMAPVTLSILILVAILLIVGMWCICCRGTCTR